MSNDKKNIYLQPPVKWIGGKRQLIAEIKNNLPNKINSYAELFCGGGAVLFEIQPKKVIINDINQELINLYTVIKEDVESLILSLSKHENTADYFYEMRELDRNKNRYDKLTNVEKASRLLFLNKTCYNGMFRVNSAGQFNAPFGYYKSPNIKNEGVLRAINKYFNEIELQLSSCDYERLLGNLEKDTFVYLDPPYDHDGDPASFTGYDKMGFDRNEQIRLRDFCDELNKRKIKFLLSNSNTDFIQEAYEKYKIIQVFARRSINCKGNKRGEVQEVLIKNY